MLENVLSKVGLTAQTQNLDQRPGDGYEASGNILKHGRVWIREVADRGREKLRVEWVFGDLGLGAELAIGDCEGPEWNMHVIVPGMKLFWSVPAEQAVVDWFRKRSIGEKYDDIDIVYATFHDGALFWRMLHSDSTWHTATPKHRHGNFGLVDFLLGKFTVTRETYETREVTIPMPEGGYTWTISMERTTITRPRWRPTVTRTFQADCKKGHQIPKPGKGESSWDCGPDAIHGMSGPGVRTIEEAIGKVVGRTLHDRRRRGAKDTYATGGIHDPERSN